MSILLNPRVLIALALSAILAFAGFTLYRAGKASVQQKWDAATLAATEKARLDERAKTVANEGVDRAYQIEKARRVAAERLADDRLRDYTATSQRADTAPSGRVDDPRPAIASECARELVALDAHAGRLAIQVAGLQGFARDVCMKGSQ